jgi:hypothetical protein
MPDLSRRILLAGLALAPVAVPAAVAFGASNALGNKLPPVVGSVRVAPPACTAPLVDLVDLVQAEFFDITTADGARLMGSTLGFPAPQPRHGDRIVRVDFTTDSAGPPPHHYERFANGQWLKVEDTAEGDIRQAEGHSPDVLDEDCAAFTVPA